MRNRLASRQDALAKLYRSEFDPNKTDMTAEANEADPGAAIHGVREDPSFAYVLDLPDHVIGGRVKDRQGSCGAEIQQTPVQADDAIVSRRSDVDSFDHLAVIRIDDEKAA